MRPSFTEGVTARMIGSCLMLTCVLDPESPAADCDWAATTSFSWWTVARM